MNADFFLDLDRTLDWTFGRIYRIAALDKGTA
jgi:hypothetical protein